eukprot:Pompholyxophrys_punicea_v1_NODE_97_length_3517_cov_29.967081.p2 type:complete len:228 gc:universal NODE_97_length_3517_cov_29.967081:796-1479(+)
MVRLYEKRQQFHKIHGKGALGDIWRSIKGLFYRGSTKAMPHIKNYAGQAIDYGKNLAGREVQRLVNQGTEYAREKARELANQAIDNPRQIENILRETRDRVKEDALNKLHREKRYFNELADSTAYDFRNHAQHLANDFRNHAHYGVNSAIDHLHHSASNAIQRIVPGHEPVTSVHTSHNLSQLHLLHSVELWVMVLKKLVVQKKTRVMACFYQEPVCIYQELKRVWV